MKLERLVNWWCGFEWCILNTEKLWSSNKFKKLKSLCNRRVSVWNPDTSKEIVCFEHEVHLGFAVSLYTFLHMLYGWNDDTMPTFTLFSAHLECLSLSGSYSSKQLVNAWKITDEVGKGWKLMMWLWMVHFEHRKSMEFQKNEIPFVTDEFPYETLILRKRLSVLYTKCIQFLP